MAERTYEKGTSELVVEAILGAPEWELSFKACWPDRLIVDGWFG
jgi:hypothetical protein